MLKDIDSFLLWYFTDFIDSYCVQCGFPESICSTLMQFSLDIDMG